MPTANGDYYGNDTNVYDEYDDDSRSSNQSASMQWKPSINGSRMNGGSGHQNSHYHVQSDSQTTFPLQSRQSQPLQQDEISRHMLYETAMLDAKDFGILSMEEVDTLKKELARLVPRLEAAQKKLTLELKVRGAAQNLQRLNRADTPQTPESPQKGVNDVQRESMSPADEEFVSSQKKVEEMHETVKQLLDRRAEVDRKLLRHTAAILAGQCERNTTDNIHRDRGLDDDAVSTYEADEYDGIRDILGGRTIGKNSTRINSNNAAQLQDIQDRLERFNSDLRAMITEAAHSRGVSLPPEPFPEHVTDASERLEQDLERLGTNLRVLQREHAESNQYTLNKVERELESIGAAFYTSLSQPAGTTKSLDSPAEPPQVMGGSYAGQLGYLSGLARNLDAVMQSHAEHADKLSRSAGQNQKLAEYESTVNGLWEVIQSDESSRPHSSIDDNAAASTSPFVQESFSLAAFNSRVQNIFDKATSAREQQNILLRQVQQQRELNGKSDAEKDKQIEDLQSNHETVLTSHNQLQEELAKTMAKHAASETDASQLRNELAKVESEVEQLKKLAQSKTDEQDALSAQLIQLNATRDKTHNEMQDLESEVVRLTTELTMTKAELEGAYGSRAERAKEAQAGDFDGLKVRSAQLEEELAAMTSEFQELTRESLELERERSHLDTLIDGLRERCETLEAQLADEKVRWMGVKSPGSGVDISQVREQTSMAVMRQEFKKMMRDARAEGIKLLRAEQEERRKIESELRKVRQANTPLGKGANGASAQV